ncbi:hypothetical protein Tco_0217707 [Tanacetum coccineum]
MEVSRLSGMDNDLFTYEVEVVNIPYNSKIDDDSEDEVDDDMGYGPSDVAFIECFKIKIWNLLTKDIEGFKTYDDYKDDWIYEWNQNVPWVDEKPWTDTGVWTKPTPVKHTCKPFKYKTGCLEWPTYLALRNKASMEGLISDDNNESCYEQRIRWDVYTNYDDAYEINHDGNKEEELCEVYEPPVCNIRKYKMIKYSFNNNEEYVAIKEDEYDDLTITRKEAYQAYQEIF